MNLVENNAVMVLLVGRFEIGLARSGAKFTSFRIVAILINVTMNNERKFTILGLVVMAHNHVQGPWCP